MADTVNCYNETNICEKCGKEPVEFIHKGDLTDDVVTELCKTCFIRLSESKSTEKIDLLNTTLLKHA